jgi:hypothetical protein
MGDPPHRASRGKNRRERGTRNVERLQQQGCVELDIRVEPPLALETLQRPKGCSLDLLRRTRSGSRAP